MKLRMFYVLALCFAGNYACASQSDTLRVTVNRCQIGDEKPEQHKNKERVMKLNESLVLNENLSHNVGIVFSKVQNDSEYYDVLAIVDTNENLNTRSEKDGYKMTKEEFDNIKHQDFILKHGEQVTKRIDDICFDLKVG